MWPRHCNYGEYPLEIQFICMYSTVLQNSSFEYIYVHVNVQCTYTAMFVAMETLLIHVAGGGRTPIDIVDY